MVSEWDVGRKSLSWRPVGDWGAVVARNRVFRQSGEVLRAFLAHESISDELEMVEVHGQAVERDENAGNGGGLKLRGGRNHESASHRPQPRRWR